MEDIVFKANLNKLIYVTSAVIGIPVSLFLSCILLFSFTQSNIIGGVFIYSIGSLLFVAFFYNLMSPLLKHRDDQIIINKVGLEWIIENEKGTAGWEDIKDLHFRYSLGRQLSFCHNNKKILIDISNIIVKDDELVDTINLYYGKTLIDNQVVRRSKIKNIFIVGLVVTIYIIYKLIFEN
jgi:hypothetical protein